MERFWPPPAPLIMKQKIVQSMNDRDPGPIISTIVFVPTLILLLVSICNLSWSNTMVAGLTIDGKSTSAFFRLGLLTGYGYVEQNGKKSLSMESYGWCRYQSFALFDDESQYCSVLTAVQVITLGTFLLACISFTICILLVSGQIKPEKKNRVIVGNTILQLFMTSGCVIAFTLWVFLHEWFNRDLKAYFPGVQLQLGSAFQCVVAAACLSFCISASAPYVWSIQPLTYIRKDLPEHADEKSDEDLRQVISSTY